MWVVIDMPPCTRTSDCGCWGCIARRQDSGQWQRKLHAGRCQKLAEVAGAQSDALLDLAARFRDQVVRLEQATIPLTAPGHLQAMRVSAAKLELLGNDLQQIAHKTEAMYLSMSERDGE